MADPITFRQIPQNLRLPGVFAELDPSKANTGQQTSRTLIIGQITGAGAAPPNQPLLSVGPNDGVTQGGAGSILAQMTAWYRKNDPFGEVWYGPVADAGGAVAATGSISFTGPATAAGTLDLYVGDKDQFGNHVQVAVTSGMTANALATAVAAAINANVNLAVIAAVPGGTPNQVNITAKNAGLAGNDIDIRLNYLGAIGGEATPAGIVATIVPMANGATNPSLTTLLANLGATTFDVIVCPYNDATSRAAIAGFLNDQAGRWNWQNQLYGHAWYAYRGTASALTTFGVTQNDQHATTLGFYDSPTTSWNVAAALAGACAVSLRADPGVPCQGLVLNGVSPPPIASRFLPSTRNTLLFDGISTFNVVAGNVVTENIITEYQLNSQYQPDNAYLEVETMYSLMALLRGLRSFVQTTFAAMKLAADGTRPPPGSGVTTPGLIRAAIVSWYAGQVDAGNAQQVDNFAAGLIVQQNGGNPSRVDILFTPILIQQLRTLAVLAQFRLF